MIRTIGYCFVRLGSGFRRTSNAAHAASSAGRHDHASPYGLWAGHGYGQRRMRGPKYHSPSSALRAMERRRLRSVAIGNN
jgi:hypothetical protein